MFGREEGPRWTGHNPRPPTFEIRSRSYDVTSTILPLRISQPLFLALLFPARSLLISRSPHISLSLSLSLSRSPPFLPLFSLSLSYSFPSFLLSSCSLLCFSVSFPPGSPLPFLCIAAALHPPGRSSRYLPTARFVLVLLAHPPPADTLSNARSSYIYIREITIADLCTLRVFDRTSDSTAMIRENHKRLFCLDVRYLC